MNSRDKDQLSILMFIVAFIVIALVFILGTESIPVEYILIFIIAIKFLYLQPTVVSMYYKVHNRKAPITRFIPFYNEVMILPEKNAIALLVSYVLLGISVALLFVPSEFLLNTLGERIALNYGVTIIRLIALLFVINMIVYTIAMCSLMREIEAVYRKFINSSTSKIFKVYSKILLILPVIRIAALVDIYNRLYTLTKLNNYNTSMSSGFELKEEK